MFADMHDPNISLGLAPLRIRPTVLTSSAVESVGLTGATTCKNNPILRAEHTMSFIPPSRLAEKHRQRSLFFANRIKISQLVYGPGRIGRPPHAPPPCLCVIGHFKKAQHWCNWLLLVPLANTAVTQAVSSNGYSLAPLGVAWLGHLLYHVPNVMGVELRCSPLTLQVHL